MTVPDVRSWLEAGDRPTVRRHPLDPRLPTPPRPASAFPGCVGCTLRRGRPRRRCRSPGPDPPWTLLLNSASLSEDGQSLDKSRCCDQDNIPGRGGGSLAQASGKSRLCLSTNRGTQHSNGVFFSRRGFIPTDLELDSWSFGKRARAPELMRGACVAPERKSVIINDRWYYMSSENSSISRLSASKCSSHLLTIGS